MGKAVERGGCRTGNVPQQLGRSTGSPSSPGKPPPPGKSSLDLHPCSNRESGSDVTEGTFSTVALLGGLACSAAQGVGEGDRRHVALLGAANEKPPPPTSTVRPGSVLLLPERPTACSAASSSAAPRPTDRPTPTPPENAMAPVGQEGVRRSSRAYTPAPFGPSHPKGRGRRRSTRAPDGARLAALGGPDRSQQEQQVKSGPPAAASADPALVPVRQASASSGCPPPPLRLPQSPPAPLTVRSSVSAAARAPPAARRRPGTTILRASGPGSASL